MAQQFLAVFLVFALLLAALWLLRRRSVSAFAFMRKDCSQLKKMHVLEKISLTPQHSIHLVRVVDTVLLIGVSSAGFCSLANVTAEHANPEPAIQGATGAGR